ncbi:MAG: tryptophan 7-halogenase [Chloroflexota bacterium]
MPGQILILGGGPAGTATALALRKHAPDLAVTVVESSAYERIRIGETLPPQVQTLLTHLGVWPAFLARRYRPAFGTTAAWGSGDLHTNQFFFNVHNRGWHLDRRDFDALLATQARTHGVVMRTQTRMVDHEQQADGRWRVTLRHAEGHCVDEMADFVVDATGRLAAFARLQGAKKVAYDQLVGAFRFFDVDASYTDSATLVEANSAGWWYSSLLPNDQLVVACMSDADIMGQHQLKRGKEWMAMAQETHHTQQRLTRVCNNGRDAAPSIYAAHTQQLDQFVGDGWLAAGDAATTFDPLSSQGIFKALRAGIFAAYAVSDHVNGDSQALASYETFVNREFAAYRETWQDYYDQERRWPASPFWQRRHRHEIAAAQ